MLYISRVVGRNRWGVVDTDDGSEEFVDGLDLYNICIKLGIHIEGVNLVPTMGRNKIVYRIGAVQVYQPQDQITTLQTKTSVLRGVDVQVVDGCITSIKWNPQEMQGMVTLRLSDYGTSCGAYILHPEYGNEPKLTLVLDDNCVFTGKSFKDINWRSEMVDMRELKDNKQAELVYRAFLHYSGIEDIRNGIIDNEDRKNLWIAYHVLEAGLGSRVSARYGSSNSNLGAKSINDVISDPVMTERRLVKKFGRDFINIANCQFILQSDSIRYAESSIRTYCDHLEGSRWAIRVRDWTMIGEFGHEMFRFLQVHTTCNSNVIRRFENYVKFFNHDARIMQAYLTLYNRFNEWIIEEGRNRNCCRL